MNMTGSSLNLRTGQCLSLWGVIINTQMSDHTAGTAHHNNEKIRSHVGSIRDIFYRIKCLFVH